MTSSRQYGPPARSWWRYALTLAACGALSAPASADEPGRRTEVGIVPLVGGDTDYGLGFGQLSCLAGLAPGVKPFRWRLESAGFISFKVRRNEEGKRELISPYQDFFVLLTVPGFLHERLRLDFRPSFTRETTQRYYGLGNASVAPPTDQPFRDYYARGHPSVLLRLRWRFLDSLLGELGTSYTENWFDVDPRSTLAQEMATGTPALRDALGIARRHGLLLVENSIVWDTRDSEISTDRGLYLQLKLRYSPKLGHHVPYEYGQLDLTNRFFLTLIPELLRIAVRTVFDLQFGDVPFYELARFEDTFALGGGNGVRGIPAQRYYGRIKAFGNFEVRSRLTHFSLRGQDFIVGSVLFADGGRLWAAVPGQPELDGSGLGLKYGLGGGLRIQKGETFVIRADVAWSPDARPISAYLTAGQAF